MRAFSVLTLLVAGLWPVGLKADEQFPYTAYVLADDVYVRSGPGRNYYPTAKLKLNEKVEVYRHDPGNWCAVRPTEGSFSWVSARYIKPLADDLGVVTESRVVARVGSQFSSVRDVIQVRLDKDERVEILEEHNSGGQSWYKIAPPAGEFRWISQDLLSIEPPHDGVSRPRPPISGDRPAHQVGQARPPTKPTEPQDTSTSVPWSAGRSESLSQAVAREPSSELEVELNELEQKVSRMVAEEPTVWVFHELDSQVEALLDRASTALERGQVRRFQRKLARLKDLRQRFQDVGETELAGTGDANDKPPLMLTGVDPKFDGEGVLRPVVSRRTDAPRYALVDSTGLVRSFLSPAPGLNLQPHVGSRIGVYGTRGYLPELRRPHVMVQRVSVIEQQRR